MSEDQFETDKDQWLAVGLNSDYKWCISQMTLACKWEIILGVLEGAYMLIVDSQVRCQINRRTDWKLLNRPLFSDFIEITCSYTTTVFRCFCSFCLGIIRAPGSTPLHLHNRVRHDCDLWCNPQRLCSRRSNICLRRGEKIAHQISEIQFKEYAFIKYWCHTHG